MHMPNSASSPQRIRSDSDSCWGENQSSHDAHGYLTAVLTSASTAISNFSELDITFGNHLRASRCCGQRCSPSHRPGDFEDGRMCSLGVDFVLGLTRLYKLRSQTLAIVHHIMM